MEEITKHTNCKHVFGISVPNYSNKHNYSKCDKKSKKCKRSEKNKDKKEKLLGKTEMKNVAKNTN